MSGRAWWSPIDVTVAGTLFAFAALEIALDAVTGLTWVIWTCALLSTAPLVVRRSMPGTAFVLVVAALAGQTLYDVSLSSIGESLAILVAAYTLTSRLAPQRALPLAIGGVLVLALSLLGLHGSNPADALFTVVLVGAPGLAGWSVRSHRLYADALADRNRLLERDREERARRAVQDERARIARELHDVVAHNLSVAIIQVVATEELLDHVREGAALRHLQAVESSCRSALSEMRRLLGILGPDELREAGAQPGMAGLEELVEGVRAAGLPVEVEVRGRPLTLPEGLDLTAYRVVQEGLTNALKHGGGSPATLTVSYLDDLVEIDVSNVVPSARSTTLGGRGLAGMRERAGMYGGTVETTDMGGRFLVRVRLPTAAVALS